MPHECLVIDDGPHDGPHNMAADEALLEAAITSTTPTAWLRFYTWTKPTLSLGYFQPIAAARQHPAASNTAVIRRPSGGGAILHHHELTYCLAVSPHHPAAMDAPGLYEAMHLSLIEALARQGVAARLCDAAVPDDQAFLCFARRASNDVLAVGPLEGRKTTGEALPKIAGSAQRRRQGAILQHGSVLLESSSRTPQLAGIREQAGVRLTAEMLRETWVGVLPRALGECRSDPRWPGNVERHLTVLRDKKYATEAWTARR
jgi:lipoate-protein ligase A